MVQIGICGSTSEALLDSVATTNLLSKRLAERLAVTFERDPKQIITANGVSCVVLGVIRQVPILFDRKVVRMKFLVLQSTPFHIIIGKPRLEEMRGCLDFGSQMVTLHIEEKVVKLPFEYAKMKLPVA